MVVLLNFDEDLIKVFGDRPRKSSINDSKASAIAAIAWMCDIVDTILCHKLPFYQSFHWFVTYIVMFQVFYDYF